MALNSEAFLSLLALDAYNRCEGAVLAYLDSTPNFSKIGNATIISDSDRLIGEDALTAGFYAIAYNWHGETIISCRGTHSGQFLRTMAMLHLRMLHLFVAAHRRLAQ